MKKRILLTFFITASVTLNFSGQVKFNQGNHSYPIVPVPNLLSNIAYTCDVLANQFVRWQWPLADSSIGILTEFCHGGEIANGIYYVTNENNVLKTINLMNAQVTTVAPITGITSGYIVKALAYKQPNGPMYAGATNAIQSNLYTLNLATGAAVLVGNITSCPNVACFAINCEGDLYGIDLNYDNTVKINTTTGAGTILGPFGINANFDQACRFDVTSNTLYWFSFGPLCELRTVNLLTGASTLIFNLPSGHQITAFGFTALCPPVPSCDMQAGPFVSLPTAFQIGVPYNIKAKITNVGTAAQTNIPVKFFVNGVQNGATQNIPSLSPGAIDTNRVFAWTPVANGSTLLKICSALGCDSNRINDTVTTTVLVGLQQFFCDNFDNLSNWTVTNNGGNCVWQCVPKRSEMMPPSSAGNLLAADEDLCGSGTTMNTTATLTNSINCTTFIGTYVEFDNDYYILGADHAKMDLSTDGGTTWINKFDWTTNRRTTHETQLLPEANQKPNVKIRFTYVAPGWDWWWAIDNVCVRGIWDGTKHNGSSIPEKYSLSQNYPNPFNPTTRIKFDIPLSPLSERGAGGFVILKVYDLLGCEVQTLVNEYKPAGTYEVTFDGSAISSGLYFFRITSGDYTNVKKMILIK